MDLIEHVIYINLDKRKDRLASIEKELLRVFPYDKIRRFSAIYHKIPYAGCTLSHIAALEIAKSNNWKNVLIVEDDMEWCNFTIENLNIFEKLVKNEYDVILLGGAFIDYNSKTYKLKYASTSHCYLVSNHYYDKLINNFKEGLLKLIESNGTAFAIDQHWKELQPIDNWYIVVPCIATQSEGFSDNGGVFTNIKDAVGKVLNDDAITIPDDNPRPSLFRFLKINYIPTNLSKDNEPPKQTTKPKPKVQIPRHRIR